MQEDTSFCPSFSSYSCDKLADIAVKVSQEFNNELEESRNDAVEFIDDVEEKEEEFEFVSVSTNPDTSSADEFQIRPVFPIFNRDLLLDYNYNHHHPPDDVAPIRLPLKKLFIEDRESLSSSSSTSSEAEDELDRIEPGTYCVWTPKQTAQSSSSPNRRCKKSNSTGSSSKRWRFRDLLKRSHSDGKYSFLFLNPEKNEKESSSKEKIKSGGHEVNVKAAKKVSSAHEAFYVRNKVLKEGDKRKSYLPYRQVGLFSSNFNGFGRTFPPFS